MKRRARLCARCEDPVSHQQTAVPGFHAQDAMVATRPGTTGCKRQREVRSSSRDFKATSGPNSAAWARELRSREKLLRTASPSSHSSSSCKRGASCLESTPCQRGRNAMMVRRVVVARVPAAITWDEERTVVTGSRPRSKGASCMAHNCLRGPILDSALCAILRPSPCDERGDQHRCVHRLGRCYCRRDALRRECFSGSL